VLLTARLLSAAYNIVHDCDEVYNYWEPLHFLLYGYGMQTWEYRRVSHICIKKFGNAGLDFRNRDRQAEQHDRWK
jgi:hypothetical protein